MANPLKLEAFFMELEEGLLNLRIKEAWAGGPIATKKVLTGIPLVLGWKPQDWITKLEAY